MFRDVLANDLPCSSSQPPCVYRILDSAILMEKAAEDRSRCNGAKPLNDAIKRCLLGQRPKSSDAVVIVGRENPTTSAARIAASLRCFRANAPTPHSP
jgi:hypothetical protein